MDKVEQHHEYDIYIDTIHELVSEGRYSEAEDLAKLLKKCELKPEPQAISTY